MTTKTQTIPADVQKKIDLLAPEMRQIIPQIKRSIAYATTQHGYGAYMSALHSMLGNTDLQTDEGKLVLFIVCQSMIAAGGDQRGIKAAAAIITGRDPIQAAFG
jgi:hypothetical protein